jgi:hypothetical protein
MAHIRSSPEEEWLARRVFGVLLTLAALAIAGIAWSRSRECARSCEEQGFAESDLRMRGGGRFEMGLDCVSSEPRAPR